MEALVDFRRSGDSVGVITLNRPEACNAINRSMARDIGKFVQVVETDPRLRVGVLTGAGRYFCAGGDLKERVPVTPGPGGFAGFVAAPKSKPWVAAVNGSSYGGGTELILACSLVVAAETATFSLPEVTLGSVPYAGGAIRIGQALPRSVALEMLLTGEPITAIRAFDLGLVNRMVPADRVVDEATELAGRIGRHPAFAVTEALRLADLSRQLPEDEMWLINQQSREQLFALPEFMEGRESFARKRSPNWST